MTIDVEMTVDRSASLPPRAAIALLSLQLRAAQQDAAAAEAILVSDPTDVAVAELRAKLLPRLEQRRVELDVQFEQAQHEAAEAVGAARVDAATRAEVEEALIEPDAADVVPIEPEPLDVVLDDLPRAMPVITGVEGLVFWPTSDVAAADDVIADDLVIIDEPVVAAAVPAPPSSGPTMVDADAFARAIASVLAAALAERGVPQHPTMQQPYYLPYPPQQPVPAKAGFWSNAKHIDVLLLFVAMVIVLVILVAWLA